MYPIIERLEVKSKFKYLWFKYVVGVNLNVHCARSLKGSYSELVTKDLKVLNDVGLNEHEAKVYYLCGVAQPSSWENNFHLAFRYKEDSVVEIDEHGIYIKIKDAERIEILPVDMDKCDSKYKHIPAYNTCRNWQFANWYKENID